MEIFRSAYKSMADTLLLPLTGIPKDSRLTVGSFLFWRDYSIFEYNIIITIDFDESISEIKRKLDTIIIPALDKNAPIREVYEIGKRLILVLDMSYWMSDINHFLNGKYSKISDKAKAIIKNYHSDNNGVIGHFLWCILYPNKKSSFLGDKTPIEYASQEYGFDYYELSKVGEIGNKYDKTAETLFTEVDELCHIDF